MQRRAFLVFSGLLIAGCATKPSSTSQATGMQFSAAERKTIMDFYAQSGGRAPAGSIPAQRARAGELLDTGQSPNKLPIELAKRLPDLPNPFTRLILGADVLLVNRDSHAILDVIPQVAY
jgi:hypothetical protein